MKFNKISLLIFLTNFNIYMHSIEPLGLTNLGNTCFLNATLQCLHSIEELTNFLLKDENKDLYQPSSVAQQYRKFVLQYQQELTKQKNKLIQNKPASFAPQNFVEKIWSLKDASGKSIFPTGATGDSQELLSIILDSFNSDINPNKIKEYYGFPYNNIPKTWIGQNLFNWFIKERLIHTKIKHPAKVNLMQSLALAVREINSFTDTEIKYKDYKDLNECLKAFFAQEEVEYTIYKKGKPKIYTMKRTKEIVTLPKILILVYKRYEFNPFTGEKTKIKHGIPFPYKNLDLKEFVSSDAPEDIQTKYDLIAISIHHGEGFHYTAIIKSNNKWFRCNDAYVEEIQEHDIEELTQRTGNDLHETPYLLFYKQHPTTIELPKTQEISLSEISEKLSNQLKETGIDKRDLKIYLEDKKIELTDILRGLEDNLISFDYIILDIKEHLEEKVRKNLPNLQKFSSNLISLNNRLIELAKG